MKGTPVGTGLSKQRMARVGVTALTAVAFAGFSQEAAASKIVVTTEAPHGEGSFAAAVRRVAADHGGDEIVFARRLKRAVQVPRGLEFHYGTRITGRARLRLEGPPEGSTLSFTRAKADSVLRDLHLDRVAVSASGSALTVRDSFVTGDGTAEGSGVYAAYGYDNGELRVLDSTVSGWELGVEVYAGDGRIDDSVISDNDGHGGVIASRSHIQVTNSTISGNVTKPDNPDYAVSGGGILGAYYGQVDVTNSTITGNVAMGTGSHGGGVAGNALVNESTITGNRAANGGGISSGPFTDYDAVVSNSIVAGNVSTDPTSGEDCAGVGFRSRGGNLIESPGSCVLQGGDLEGVNAGLRPLADNGGPTPTQMLRKCSIAIGLADPRTATKFDQRGVRRNDDPDSGAYEAKGATPGDCNPKT